MAEVTHLCILGRVRLTRLLFIAFVATPITEIALFVVVGDRIGIGPTLAIVVITAIVGASLVSRQGRGAVAAARQELARGAFPGRQLAHGAMILFAGALLLTPGFLTDAVGFALLVPGIREVLRRWAVRRYGEGPITIG